MKKVLLVLACSLCMLISVPALAQDADGDGILDSDDLCSATEVGDVADDTGCSIDQLCPCSGPAAGGSWENHGDYVSCVSHTAQDFAANGHIDRRDVGKIVNEAAQSSCGFTGDGGQEPPPEEPTEAELSLVGVSRTSFNPVSGTFSLEVTGASFSTDSADVEVFINDQPIPDTALAVAPQSISVDYTFQDGRNDLLVFAVDSADRSPFLFDAVLWAGSGVLQIEVVDGSGLHVDGAQVEVRLTDDLNVSAESTSIDGFVVINNLPFRTLIVRGTDDQNRFGTTSSVGGFGSVLLELSGFKAPSAVDNNDFSLGTDGWDIGSAPVELIDHVEPSALLFESTHDLQLATATAEDVDLALNTLGEGPQSISRTFEVAPGTKSVNVRYRFITSEVPGGFFGTQFNDYFSVSIRSLQGGGIADETNSMNGLGLGAFDAIGATAWREVDLPVSVEGDTIQVDVTVANVADGLFDSQVVLDKVDEKALAITQLDLRDINNESLGFLSAASHPYFAGTRLNGTVRIEGAADDSLESLDLEVVQGGAAVATASLHSNAQGALLQAFGEDELVEIATSQLLFEIAPSQLSNIDGGQNGTVNLRLRARTANGEETTEDLEEPVAILVRYTNANRFGGRDGINCIDNDGTALATLCGGDDWVLPSVKPVVEHFSGITVNDFSNMNGGPFPPHDSHQVGRDVDGFFSGYGNLDANTAATIIGHLNDPTFGSSIQLVFVTFQREDTDPFWNAIKDVTLDNGQPAQEVIRAVSDHDTHFHWRINR